LLAGRILARQAKDLRESLDLYFLSQIKRCYSYAQQGYEAELCYFCPPFKKGLNGTNPRGVWK